jgi:uncharacterized membrane protein YbhN (UPF0104 family)
VRGNPFFSIISSFTGFSIMAGICFLVKPESMPSASHLPSHLLSAFGFFFTFLVAAYTAMVFLTRKPLKLGKHFLRLPARTIFPKQILLGVYELLQLGKKA